MEEYLERASYQWSEDSIRLIHTPAQEIFQNFFYVQEVGYFQTSPPYFTERKNLDSFLIVYTLSGKGILKFREKEYKLHSGQAFFIHCMQHHLYQCAKNCEWEFLWLHFQGSSSKGYYELFDKYKNPIFAPKNHEKFALNMRRILSLIDKKNVDSEIICADLITNLLTEIVTESLHEEERLMITPVYIRNAMEELDKNFQDDIALEELAQLVGISKFYLLKQFKRYTGNTVGEYLLHNRLNYAKELLKYSEHSIEEITFLCGMHHVSHFINLFKRHENMTPLAYRKAWNLNHS